LSEAKHEEENMPSVHTSTYGLLQCTKDGEKKRERERERERKRESERGEGMKERERAKRREAVLHETTKCG